MTDTNTSKANSSSADGPLPVDALALLAYKVGPNMFDLSTGVSNVSIRDQMHRAIALADALVVAHKALCKREAKLVAPNGVLIVGAGVAGATAAIVLAHHGIPVNLIDRGSEPFGLFKNVKHRYVGPLMYEWPLGVHTSQRFPPQEETLLGAWACTAGKYPELLKFENPEPVAASELVAPWQGALKTAIDSADSTLGAWMKVATENEDANRLQKSLNEWHPDNNTGLDLNGVNWPTGVQKDFFINPLFVVLAAGMGPENLKLTDAKSEILFDAATGWMEYLAPFWASKDWLAECGGLQDKNVVVFGGGDGAIQDALRAMTEHEHPLATWNKLVAAYLGDGQDLSRRETFDDALRKIVDLEHQAGHLAIWRQTRMRPHSGPEQNEVEATAAAKLGEAFATASLGNYAALDRGYIKIVDELLKCQALVKILVGFLRKEIRSVTLVVRESHFGKAYALNRFLAHLFFRAMKRAQDVGLANATKDLTVQFQDLLSTSVARAAPASYEVRSGKPITFTLQTNPPSTISADIALVRFGVDKEKIPAQMLGLTEDDTVNRYELSALPTPLYLPPLPAVKDQAAAVVSPVAAAASD